MDFFQVVENFVGGFMSIFNKTLMDVEKTIEYKIDKLRRKFFRTIITLFFILLSLSFLITGIVLFFTRFFPKDLVFVGAGVILLYIALMFKLVK